MKFLNAPRQPFVGLSLAAAIGITIADVFPLPGAALVPVTIILAICTVIVACRPTLLATYAIVGVGFSCCTTLRRTIQKASDLLTNLAADRGSSRQSGPSSLSQKSLPVGLRRFC